MNLENYKALCRACDELLADPEAGRVRLAISWLHVVREHPHFLKNYEYLFDFSERFVWLLHIKKLIYYLFSWGQQIIRSLTNFDCPMRSLIGLPNSVDLLIVSHLISAADLSVENDFYFDALPGFLRREGRSVVVLLINHTDRRFVDKLQAVCPSDEVHRIVLSDTMHISKTWSCFLESLYEGLALLRIARKITEPLARRVSWRAAVEVMSGGTRDAQKIGIQVAEIARDLNCSAVLTTYEGHAWERAVFRQVRLMSPTVQCFAYQHAVVFRYQHGLRRSLGSSSDPDVVFASGEIPRAELARCGVVELTRLRIFGSNRAVVSDNLQPNLHVHLAAKECLVLPEGLNTESAIMIRFACACARELLGIRFVIRLHPAVNWEILQNAFPELTRLPKNVVFSKTSLEQDARRARWVLYRGSTAVVAGAQYGALPIYLQDENEEMSIDPLYLLGDERIAVRTVKEFSKCVYISSLNSNAESERREKMLSYFNGLFAPLNFKTIAESLQELPKQKI
jgi:hypothetical protein